MNKIKYLLLTSLLCCGAGLTTYSQHTKAVIKSKLWTIEQANAWYKQHGWLSGANFIPSTAVNQLEMWQAATFDPATIDKELGYAENIGFNTMRVFLHSVAYGAD